MLNLKSTKGIAFAGAIVAGVALAGCGGGGVTDATNQKANDDEIVVTDRVIEDEPLELEDGNDESAKATEWKPAGTADEAIDKAGLPGGFSVPDKVTVGGTELSFPEFSYIDGIAQATYQSDDLSVQIRKGVGPGGTVVEDDHTGFMGEEFAESWEAEADGTSVTCHGDTKDEVLFAQWYDKVDPEVDGEDDAYSIRVLDDTDSGVAMTNDELVKIVSAVK
jgi:hypothetical protein